MKIEKENQKVEKDMHREKERKGWKDNIRAEYNARRRNKNKV